MKTAVGYHIDVNAIIDRLKILLEAITDLDLCSRLKVPQSTLSNWRSRNSMSLETVIKIAADTGATLDGLILGRTPMETVWALPLSHQANPADLSFSIAVNKNHNSPEDIAELLTVPVTSGYMEPTVSAGDLAIVRATKGGFHITPGLYAIRDGNDLVVRRLQQLGKGTIQVIPDNKRYPAYIAQANELEIVGKVIITVKREAEETLWPMQETHPGMGIRGA